MWQERTGRDRSSSAEWWDMAGALGLSEHNVTAASGRSVKHVSRLASSLCS